MPFLDFSLSTDKSFAFIEKNGVVSLFQGDVYKLDQLHDLHTLSRKINRDLVFVLPYRSIREKGFESHGDEPILAMSCDTVLSLPVDLFLKQVKIRDVALKAEIQPSVSDADFANLVRKFKIDEIERGLCSQTTLSRKFLGQIDDFTVDTVVSLYANLLKQPGHYMTVLFANIDTGRPQDSHFILAGTPERHLEIKGNETIMCPIAGTCRKESRETFDQRIRAFLEDRKEINELFQVLDEEMKMMGNICPKGGTIYGPYLREVGAVVHTEYTLIGRRSTHSIDALRATLHAPTVVGSPLRSAARLITKYEQESRRYYAGEIGIYRQSRTDTPDGDLDCAILIRGAEFSGDGSFHIQSGAGIVRDSDPESEAKETKAKALGMLNVLSGTSSNDIYITEDRRADLAPLLVSRNAMLSKFWQSDQIGIEMVIPEAINTSVAIVNNEDDFAFMIQHMLHAFGFTAVDVIDTYDFDPGRKAYGLVILGPGPGDPSDMSHPRMEKLQSIIKSLLAKKHRILGICLGHQALAISIGIPVLQQSSSTQGMPREVSIQGTKRTLGFYNSFSPICDRNSPNIAGLILDRDNDDRIIALRAPNICGYQFHPESVMSIDGIEVMKDALQHLLRS